MWLLEDLCTKLGFSMAVLDADRFIALVHQGPDTLADTVLLAEGLDPTLEKRLRRKVRERVGFAPSSDARSASLEPLLIIENK